MKQKKRSIPLSEIIIKNNQAEYLDQTICLYLVANIIAPKLYFGSINYYSEL